MNKNEIKVKTLKRYSITEQVVYITRLKFSYRPKEDRARLQSTFKASVRIWNSSSNLATPRGVSKPASGCPGTFLEMQTFCPTPEVLNQILSFNKLLGVICIQVKVWAALLKVGDPPMQERKYWILVPKDPSAIIPKLSVLKYVT